MKRNILFAAIAAGALMGLGSAAQAESAIVVQMAPPAPLSEVIPAPREGFVWAPGHYAWRDGQYVWRSGHWVPERAGYAWRSDRWVQRPDGSWTFVAGYWDPSDRVSYGYGRRPMMGDRDRDGVPNRFDADRDGDGVPNAYDAHPNNRWRD